jgi:prepilin-type N-terminal cleavage/methylation domain-containing protein
MKLAHGNRVPQLGDKGVTLVEMMMAVLIFAIVMVVVNGVFFSSNRLYGNTTVRAGQQMNARVGISVMVTELRTAGCDPLQIGVPAVLTAAADSAHVRADYDGDGAISTAEPSEDILYYYDAGQQAIIRDPGTGPQVMIRNVTAFTFTYFDEDSQELAQPIAANDLDRVRSIGIALTTQTERGGEVTTDTRVTFRND